MSLTVAPSTSFECSLDVGTTGLVGTIAVGIYEGSTDTATQALATTTINEIGTTGVYVATRTSPAAAGQYLIVWSLDGTLTPAQLATEDLVVTGTVASALGATAGDYTTLAIVKDALGLTVNTYDTRLARHITSASRAIDDICDRRFYLDADALQVRYYTPTGTGPLFIDDLTTLGSVKVDSGYDGLYATTWTRGTEYTLEPGNAAADGWPFTRIKLRGRSGSVWYGDTNYVKVTGQFGWPSVPYPIAEATVIVTVKLFKRPETPFGIMTAGVEQATAMRIASNDPDVRMLTHRYVRLAV